jgi:hypothetical protein
MTRQEFCERHKIPLTTLGSWERSERKLANPRLLAVRIQSNTAAKERETGCGFALSLANGRRIECSSWQFADTDLLRLIRAAEQA